MNKEGGLIEGRLGWIIFVLICLIAIIVIIVKWDSIIDNLGSKLF